MKNYNNHTLLLTLKELYCQLSMVVAQIRLRSYRFLFESKNTFDITSVLNKKVNDLAARALKENICSEKNSNKKQQPGFAHNKKQNINYKKIENVSGIESEFAKHLKQRKSSSITQPHMGDKLKASAWEHIHSAIRFAKQGQVGKAKLHADIAGHALEEAGHYMNDEEYSELVYHIEHYFTESQKK